MNRLVLVAAALSMLAAPAYAQNGGSSTTGPASGSTAQPTANATGNGDKSMTGANGSSGSSVGAPGKAGKAGAESDPGTVKPPK